MIRMFIWAQPNWPHFRIRHKEILSQLSAVRLKQGRLLGTMLQLGFDVNLLAQLGALTEDAVKTSEIEGELLDRDEVRSSLARRLGVDQGGVHSSDAKIEGLVEVMLDATGNYNVPLSKQRLFDWHSSLFPADHSRLHEVNAGKWRTDADGPMQVVSGAIGRQRIHYEAPPAERVDAEMERFLEWFNNENESDGLLRAAVAHLWFVTIHPFEDGNGRLARTISDMALAQSEGSGKRFYSMSSQIRTERKRYYEILERTQRGDVDITSWVQWFLDCLGRALDNADSVCGTAMRKATFWQKYAGFTFNERQRKVLNLVLDGLEGKLTAPKWAKLTNSSPATALRDIAGLVQHGILVKGPGGSKNTSYELTEKV